MKLGTGNLFLRKTASKHSRVIKIFYLVRLLCNGGLEHCLEILFAKSENNSVLHYNVKGAS